jgi:choline dehydrogenase-like flavoprotein
MIHDRAPDGATLTADVCIVGSGPAGMALAFRLARDPRLRVALLESGGQRFEAAAQDLARGDVAGHAYMPLHESRVRALGGSTWSWGGTNTRMDPLTYEPRSWVDGAWPIPSSATDAYLDEALELLGVGPAERAATDAAVAELGRKSGLDPSCIAPVPVYFSRPIRFGEIYRRQLACLPNVHVYMHTTVTSLEADGGRIVAAHAMSDGRPVRIEARAYALAGGGIENPRLLMVSEMGGPAVGRYFMEHPRVRNRYSVRAGDTPLHRLIARGLHSQTLPFARLEPTGDLQRREQLLNAHLNLRFGSIGHRDPHWSSVRRLLQASRRPWNESPYFHDAGGGRMRHRSSDLGTALRRPDRSAIGIVGSLVQHPALHRFLEIWTTVEQAPDPENRIELLTVRDAAGMPRVRLHWTVGAAETRTYERVNRLVLMELEKLEPGLSDTPPDEPDAWPDQISGNWHHIGTTRMHDDPARGVVDRDCRVHGIGNVYVAGSSVFPISGSTSPTLLVVQLAFRLADHLSGELASSTTVASGSTVPSAIPVTASDAPG